MSLDQEIIRLFSDPDYIPLTTEEIIKELELTKNEIKRLKRQIAKMLDEGSIAKIKRNRFCLPKDADLVSGTIKFRQSGAAIVIPDNMTQTDGKVLSIRSEDTWVSFHDDRVLVRLVSQERRHHRHRRAPRHDADAQYGRVIRILQRSFETITGTFKRAKLHHYIIPDDPRIIQDILVSEPTQGTIFPHPRPGDKVVVRLHDWEQRHLNPEGEITEVLGKTHEPSAEFKAILHKYKLNPDFPPAVMTEVAKVPEKVQARDIARRRDCRNLLTLTIDPDDAKDFDDALSIEELPDGATRIGIHIADVSAYVKPTSRLGKEAQKRGNSSYLVGCVIPMLPHALSNGICSLVEGEDRLTKSVFLTFDNKNNLQKTDFANTVIHSQKRLTYHQAFAFMQEDDLNKVANTPLPPGHQTGHIGRALSSLPHEELRTLQKAIRKLWDIAKKMRKARFKKGSLDLEMSEIKIYVDPEGYADRIAKITNDESHQLIEEFMLAANEHVAKALFDAGMPFISRVHDQPDSDKLFELRDSMMTSGIVTGDLTNRQEVVRMLKKINAHPQGYTLKIEFLRSLKQACYRAETDGHYGLAKTFYAHFTSPIRRYSDLIVHRIFDLYLAKRGIDSAPRTPPKAYSKGDLESLSQHLSITERNSTDAERDSVKTKLLEYFERELDRKEKSTFEAYITDIKNHGLFIELTESMTYGLIHISTLQDDLYRVTDEGRALVGRKTMKRYELGQIISVSVERVDRFKRQIDFRVATDKEPKKKSKRAFEYFSKKKAMKKATKKTKKPQKFRPRKRRNK